MFATPHIQDYLKNNTDIYNKVVAYCEEAIREKAEQEVLQYVLERLRVLVSLHHSFLVLKSMTI